MAEITPQEIANIVFKAHNEAMISMLNNSIKIAKNKHEKRAYKNVIEFVLKEDKKRVEAFKKEEKPKSPIILLK